MTAVQQICEAFGLVLDAGGDVPADATSKAEALDAATAGPGAIQRARMPA